MTSKIQTALRLALEAKRFTDLADIEVHRTRRGHWHPPDVPCTGAARWATRAPPWRSTASSSGPPGSPSPPSRPPGRPAGPGCRGHPRGAFAEAASAQRRTTHEYPRLCRRCLGQG